MFALARSILSRGNAPLRQPPQRIVASNGPSQQKRFLQLAPRNIKYLKRHKGSIPIPTGGSTKGTLLSWGEWGIRIKGAGVRFSAKQLFTAEEVIKRKLKTLKGTKVMLRVFPDVPVCIKGNETRMGKGKGAFEFWACRIPTGRVIFEIGGAPIREELARDILRQAAAKMPTQMEFIGRNAHPRLGNTILHPPKLPREPKPTAEIDTQATTVPVAGAGEPVKVDTAATTA